MHVSSRTSLSVEALTERLEAEESFTLMPSETVLGLPMKGSNYPLIFAAG